MTVGGAEFKTAYGSIAAGGGDSRLGWFVDVDGSRSDRFLDPVSFDSFHNEGNTVRGFLRLDSVSENGTSNWRLTGNIGTTHRDVTNLPSQEEAGQDQTVASTDWNVNLGYQKILGDGLVLEAQVYARDNRLTLYSSPFDTPVQADQNRSLENQGINLALSKVLGVHELKFGVQAKRFPIKEQFSFLITDPGLNDANSESYNPNLAPYDGTRGGSPFTFSGSKTGSYLAAFVQDNIRWNDLTVNVGLRYDHNNLFISEDQFQPRIGVAYLLKATNTVFRASYNRMFITPEYENILLSLLPAGALDHAARAAGQPAARRRRPRQRLRTPRRLELRHPAGDRVEGPPRRLALVPQGEERGRPGPVLQHGHRLSAQLRERQPPGMEPQAGPRARPRRPARLRLGRPRARQLLQSVRRGALSRRGRSRHARRRLLRDRPRPGHPGADGTLLRLRRARASGRA